MSKIVIHWKPGITKIENIGLKPLKVLDRKGFYVLLGGKPYASNITYETVKSIYVGASFNQDIREALLGYPEKNEAVKYYLDNHPQMDLLFTCGILKQPSAQAISPDNVKKVKGKLIEQINPVCNELSVGTTSDIEIEHKGTFEPLINRTGRV